MDMEARPYGNRTFEFLSTDSAPRPPYIFISARLNKLDATQRNARLIAEWLMFYKLSDVEVDEGRGFYVKFPTNEDAESCYREQDHGRPFLSSRHDWLLDKGMTIKTTLFLKEPETSMSQSENVANAVRSTDSTLPNSSSPKSFLRGTSYLIPKDPTIRNLLSGLASGPKASSREDHETASSDRANGNRRMSSISPNNHSASLRHSLENSENNATPDTIESSASRETSGIDAPEIRTDNPESSSAWGQGALLEKAGERSTLPRSSSLIAVNNATRISTAINEEILDGDVQGDKGMNGTAEKSVTMSRSSAIPTSLIQLARTLPEDDSSSVITPSEHSSTASKPRQMRCHECKETHTTTRNPLGPCDFCPRRFHKSCQRPTPDENQPASSWGCYRCVKKGRVKDNRTLDSSSASGKLTSPNVLSNGPEDPVEAAPADITPYTTARKSLADSRLRNPVPEKNPINSLEPPIAPNSALGGVQVPIDFVAMDSTSAPSVRGSRSSGTDSRTPALNGAESTMVPDSAEAAPKVLAVAVATNGTPSLLDPKPTEDVNRILESLTVPNSAELSHEGPAEAAASVRSPALQHGLVPGQCLIAKYRGHSPWPSIICDEEMLPEAMKATRPVSAKRIDGTYREDYQQGGKRAKDRRYPIMFLGTNEFSWIHNTDLQPLNMVDVKKQLKAGPRAKSNKALDLWNAYRVAAERHDLPWFKDLLAEHERAIQDYEAARADGYVGYVRADGYVSYADSDEALESDEGDPITKRWLTRRFSLKNGESRASEIGEVNAADVTGIEKDKLQYGYLSEQKSRGNSAAQLQTSNEQDYHPLVDPPSTKVVFRESVTSGSMSKPVDKESQMPCKQSSKDLTVIPTRAEEELTDGSMEIDSPSSGCIGGVIMDSPTTSLDAGSPTVQGVTEGNSHEPEYNQLKPGKRKRSKPLNKSLESAPRSKAKAVRCMLCKGLIPRAPGSKALCTKCKIATIAAGDATKLAIVEPEAAVAQPTIPPGPTSLLSLHPAEESSNRSLDDPMELDQPEPDSSICQRKERPNVESVFQRDRSSSLSPLSEVPTEKTGTPLEDSAVQSESETSEGLEAAAYTPSTPIHQFKDRLKIRDIIGLALLAFRGKENPTTAEIAEWFCNTLPYHKQADLVHLKKTLGPILTQHKHFLGSNKEGEKMRWRFATRGIARMCEQELTNCLEAFGIASLSQSPFGSKNGGSRDERESDPQPRYSRLSWVVHDPSISSSRRPPLASSQGGPHWEQVTRGVYKLSKGPAPNGDIDVQSRARTVHLKDVCYSTDGEVKYLHPDGNGDGREAWGKIDRIELLDNGRCQIRTLRYIDKNEASALGCKNLREWPRKVKYMRRGQTVMDEISGDDLRGCLSLRESNSVSPALYLSLEESKYKIRVDSSVVGDERMRHGVDWVESSSDIEDFETLPETSPRNRTSNKSRFLDDQASGGHQEDLAPMERPAAPPVPAEKHPEELDNPLAAKPDEGHEAVHPNLVSPNPSTRSSGRGRDNMRAALPSPVTTESTGERGSRSGPLFVPTTKISPKRAIVGKDFNTTFPEYVSWDAEERARKIREIQQRPSRKATFGKKLAFARTHRSNPHVEIESTRRVIVKASHSSMVEDRFDKQSDEELSDGDDQVNSSESEKAEEDGNGLKKLLGLPKNFIPIVYENQLAFRDGTVINGRLPRTKAFYKVGRNVAGQLI
ncbi:hypothetical protein BU16DRAFT_566006 [Lophium mytilinum]|uniref:PHD-type domain-containing protein n=1 Tax=Lophium mytilinum TaxID=390894 RepID=A0A6A6QFY5_9PEZI|nr:hypothetical protein BU16DRAFT_566006 [Lophium mytilinum]